MVMWSKESLTMTMHTGSYSIKKCAGGYSLSTTFYNGFNVRHLREINFPLLIYAKVFLVSWNSCQTSVYLY